MTGPSSFIFIIIFKSLRYEYYFSSKCYIFIEFAFLGWGWYNFWYGFQRLYKEKSKSVFVLILPEVRQRRGRRGRRPQAALVLADKSSILENFHRKDHQSICPEITFFDSQSIKLEITCFFFQSRNKHVFWRPVSIICVLARKYLPAFSWKFCRTLFTSLLVCSLLNIEHSLISLIS